MRICDVGGLHAAAMAVTYASRIDAWLPIALAASIVAAAAGTWRAAAERGSAMWLVIGPVLLLALALPAWLFADTSYTITATELLVRSGPFRWRIALRDITRVESTRSVLSAPALSLDRLRIDYGRGSAILVSPRDRAGFVAELEQRRGGGPLAACASHSVPCREPRAPGATSSRAAAGSRRAARPRLSACSGFAASRC